MSKATAHAQHTRARTQRMERPAEPMEGCWERRERTCGFLHHLLAENYYFTWCHKQALSWCVEYKIGFGSVFPTKSTLTGCFMDKVPKRKSPVTCSPLSRSLGMCLCSANQSKECGRREVRSDCIKLFSLGDSTRAAPCQPPNSLKADQLLDVT